MYNYVLLLLLIVLWPFVVPLSCLSFFFCGLMNFCRSTQFSFLLSFGCLLQVFAWWLPSFIYMYIIITYLGHSILSQQLLKLEGILKSYIFTPSSLCFRILVSHLHLYVLYTLIDYCNYNDSLLLSFIFFLTLKVIHPLPLLYIYLYQ